MTVILTCTDICIDLTESIINTNAGIGGDKILLDDLPCEDEDWKQVQFRIHSGNRGGRLFE